MFEGLNAFLEPIREKRARVEGSLKELKDIFLEGSEKARQTARQTLEEVREKMKL
jgi:tryptophanyl-tRNA synthetase